jgi:hypothetical protein
MRTGAFAYLRYGWESSFGGGASTRDKVFCRGQRITALGDRHNLQPIPELGYREFKGWAYKQFEGVLSVEGILSNPWWIKALMGSVSTSGTGPYTHTFTKANTLPSMEVEIGFAGEAGNVIHLLRGSCINSATISTAVNEMVTLRLDVWYGNRAAGSTLSSALVDSFIPFTMQHAFLEIPSGTVIGEVQNLEITITNNLFRRYEIGDYVQKDALPQLFEATGRMVVALKDASMIGWVRGSQSTGRIRIQSATDNIIKINLADLLFEEWSTPIEPAAPVTLDLPFRARDVSSIEAVNNISTPP